MYTLTERTESPLFVSQSPDTVVKENANQKVYSLLVSTLSLYNCKVKKMLQDPVICLSVLNHLKDWKDRESFARTCRRIREVCLYETHVVPPLVINFDSPSSLTALQTITCKSVTLALDKGSESAVTMEQIISMVRSLSRVKEFAIKTLFRRRAKKAFAGYLASLDKPIALHVPTPATKTSRSSSAPWIQIRILSSLIPSKHQLNQVRKTAAAYWSSIPLKITRCLKK